MWEIIVQIKGDNPSEEEVEATEEELQAALDNADFDYMDVRAR